MREKLPPLFTLQTFETAARLGSFSRAAEELSLTPGAISKQIRLLEDWCRVTLFERKGPRVILTPEGRALFQRLDSPLSELQRAMQSPLHGSQHLQISTLVSIAREWLLPRLPDFVAQHPHIHLTIQTDQSLLRPAPRVPMLALRHGLPPNDVYSEVLFDDRLIAVAAPQLARELGRVPQAWPGHMVMHHDAQDPHLWFDMAGLDASTCNSRMAFNDADLALDASERGLGIAITRVSIAWRRLTQGSLVLASEVITPSHRKNLLVVREDCIDLPAVRHFANWVRDQAREWQTLQMAFDDPAHPLRKPAD